jgi:DinB superfamily
MSVNFVEESAAVLARTPAAMDALLRGLPEAWTTATEGEGTWSPDRVIGHLIHCERVDWMPRVRMTLVHGTGRVFDPVDREAREEKPLPAMLDEFAALRGWTCRRGNWNCRECIRR